MVDCNLKMYKRLNIARLKELEKKERCGVMRGALERRIIMMYDSSFWRYKVHPDIRRGSSLWGVKVRHSLSRTKI